MAISDISSKNFAFLRYSHDISAAELALALQLKRPSSITNLENGKAAPSYELLECYVDMFGVTLDWLAGRTSQIYTQDSLLTAEKRLLAKLKEIDYTGKYSEFSPSYVDESKRQENYSFFIRGNIIFLMNIQYLPMILNLLEFERNNESEQLFMGGLLNKIVYGDMEDRYLDNLKKKNRQRLELLAGLLSRWVTVPPYDIEKYSKQ